MDYFADLFGQPEVSQRRENWNGMEEPTSTTTPYSAPSGPSSIPKWSETMNDVAGSLPNGETNISSSTIDIDYEEVD